MGLEALGMATGAITLPVFFAIPGAALTFIGFGLMLSVMVTAFAWMISEFAQLAELKAWARSEAYEMFITALIVGGVVGLAMLLETSANALIGGGTGSVTFFTYAELYLGTMFGRLLNAYNTMLGFEVIIGLLSTLGIGIMFPEGVLWGVSLGVTPLAGLQMISNAQILLIDTVGMALASIVAQQALLEFIKGTMLKFFLPLGLVFRAFPISRKLGSTVIAISIVAYFVFPMTLILNSYMLSNYEPTRIFTYRSIEDICKQYYNNPNAGQAAADQGTEARNYYFNQEGWGSVEYWKSFAVTKEGVQEAAQRTNHLMETVGKYVWSMMSLQPKLYLASMYDWMLGEIIPVAQFFAFTFMLLVIDIIICITIFRDLSMSMGGEYDIMGMSKII